MDDAATTFDERAPNGARLTCLAGPLRGRDLCLRSDRSLRLEVKHKGEGTGELIFRPEAGTWVFVNESAVASQVNGQDLRRAVLADGDDIQVGTMVLEARLPPPGSGPYEVRSGLEEVDEEADDEDRAETDRIDTPPPSPERSSRRISASREAVVFDAPSESGRRSHLLRKVGRALRRRNPQEERLVQLEHDRTVLLRRAGRQALEGLGGFGLDDDFLRRLCAGETLVMSVDTLDAVKLEHFRHHRDRLAALDVEIEALRLELGLGPDSDRLPPAEVLSTEVNQQRERAFAASDNLRTDDLTDLVDDDQINDAARCEEHEEHEGQARKRARRRRR